MSYLNGEFKRCPRCGGFDFVEGFNSDGICYSCIVRQASFKKMDNNRNKFADDMNKTEISDIETTKPKPLADGPRVFSTGATRNSDTGKYDPDGFLSPLVIDRFCEYMHKHRHLQDGSLRASDNWQKGIPRDAYMKSAWRHFFDWWAHHRKFSIVAKEALEEALCALLFNVQGYLHELLKDKAVRKNYGPVGESTDV